MQKLIALLAGLAAAPILGVVALQAAAPAFADVTVNPATACIQPSANPHPTDPAGSTTNALFCASPSPSSNGSGTGNGSTGSGGSGSGGSGTGGTHGSGTTTAGTTAGGSQGTLASTNGSGTSSGSSGSGVSKSSGKSTPSSSGGFFGGLVSFFSATGGLVFLFALLVLMAIVLLAVAVIAWLRGGQEGGWSSRASRLTFRPKN
jgi:hypothetical protein